MCALAAQDCETVAHGCCVGLLRHCGTVDKAALSASADSSGHCKRRAIPPSSWATTSELRQTQLQVDWPTDSESVFYNVIYCGAKLLWNRQGSRGRSPGRAHRPRRCTWVQYPARQERCVSDVTDTLMRPAKTDAVCRWASTRFFSAQDSAAVEQLRHDSTSGSVLPVLCLRAVAAV